MIFPFAMGGWIPPIHSGFAFVPIQGTGGHWTFSSDLQGANRPPSQRPGVSSHRQRFAAAGPSVSWRQPYAFALDQPTSNSSGRSFRQGGWLPPHKNPRLPVKFRLMMSANPLRFSFYRTKGRVTRRSVALPHGRCYLATL